MKNKLTKSVKFIIPAALFYAVLNIFFKSFGFSASAIALLFLISTLSTIWITKYRLLPVIITNLLSAGSVVFLLTIGKNEIQQYYIVLVSLLFMTALFGAHRFFIPRKENAQEEKIKIIDSGFNLNQSITMFSVFLLSGGIYGIYTIVGIQTWQMMFFIFISIYLSSYYLIKINFIKSQELGLHLDYYKNLTFNFYSFLMGLIVLELSWVMTFLPINHLTFGAIILAVYYSVWNIIKKYLRNELTRKRFLDQITFLFLSIILILATSRLSIT